MPRLVEELVIPTSTSETRVPGQSVADLQPWTLWLGHSLVGGPSRAEVAPAHKPHALAVAPMSSFIRRKSGTDQDGNFDKPALERSSTLGNLSFDNSERARNEIERVRALLRFTIPPEGRFLRRWDLVLCAALTYTCFATPCEIAFMRPTVLNPGLVFLANRLVDIIFAADMVINFFTPFRETAKKGGRYVYNVRRIASHCVWSNLGPKTSRCSLSSECTLNAHPIAPLRPADASGPGTFVAEQTCVATLCSTWSRRCLLTYASAERWPARPRSR